MLVFPIDKNLFFTIGAILTCILTLFLNMELHVFTQQSQTTAFDTWLHHHFTCLNMSHRSFISLDIFTPLVGTFKPQSIQTFSNKPI